MTMETSVAVKSIEERREILAQACPAGEIPVNGICRAPPTPAPESAVKAATGPNSDYVKISNLGEKLEQLPKGDIFLDAPKAMKVGDKRQVDANVGINVPLEILQKKVGADYQSIKGIAHLSSEMIATLTGPGFRIDPLTPERQTIAEGFPSVWSWKVEATDAGDQR